MSVLNPLRDRIRCLHLQKEDAVLDGLLRRSQLSDQQKKAFSARAAQLVQDIRDDDQPGLMEVFLAEYGLSTDEGVALMCLAEALLRVPDADTMDDLIEDKIAPSSWGLHLGRSSSSLVNASTWALLLTGKVLNAEQSLGVAGVMHNALKRLGEPVIRVAVKKAMAEMGNQFVLGQTIEAAIKRGATNQKKGYTYSYDMLGEAAITARDAAQYYQSYENSIRELARRAASKRVRENPGISIKLSALHPRYEEGQRERVLSELVERTLRLCLMAKAANIGLNIDAEEADRLDLSLDIIQTVLRDPALRGWDGFGVVVQAYSKRASAVIDYLYQLAKELDRKIMVRLVKGAYWDTEIKRSQVEGLKSYPVFTRKSATDISYICCAEQLLAMTDRIYPQFATHNAHSVATILEMGRDTDAYEFQRLHGMGGVLHRLAMQNEGAQCRIYAPVGAHEDLLAYLVRRLLENGANSSFVNQLVDEAVSPAEIAQDPFLAVSTQKAIPLPAYLYAPNRENSRGWDVNNSDDLAWIDAARAPFKNTHWQMAPIVVMGAEGDDQIEIINPANPNDNVGTVIEASVADVKLAIQNATDWSAARPKARAQILRKASDLFEANAGEFFALLNREAGKITADAIAEIREAVDFLRFYADQTTGLDENEQAPRGLVTCISPWNFPLAIFTGQIAAALAAGNGVLAKPAEPTTIIAGLAVKLLHQAGVPKSVLQFLPGRGDTVGAALVSNPAIKLVCFTGSTQTAQHINRAMAANLDPYAPLIAETGGLNAMIVDSTALPEQTIENIVASSFQSAGQRCSSLRLLYLQSDIAPDFLDMLYGAMDEQVLADPWEFSTDIGPIITASARDQIADYIQAADRDGRLLKTMPLPKEGVGAQKGHFVGPSVISVSGIADLECEIFGPVLHVAIFDPEQLPDIVEQINAAQYGLTFGLHTRIDQRVEFLTQNLNIGNLYVNRNQIGAVVGSQPFGGEGLSGTGPKAGGPHYVPRFTTLKCSNRSQNESTTSLRTSHPCLPLDAVQASLNEMAGPSRAPLSTHDMPGPTGESNRLSTHARGKVLCLGPSLADAIKQAKIARAHGCVALMVCHGVADMGEANAINGRIDPKHLSTLNGFDLVVYWGGADQARAMRQALAKRDGVLISLAGQDDLARRCIVERHICIDTTASGGNVNLLAGL